MDRFDYILLIYYILVFYIISGLSTTDILRLLKGSERDIFSKGCYCDHCHYKIKLLDQAPIISYIINHGECKNCHAKIPKFQLFQEIFLFCIFILSGILTGFKAVSIIINFLFYQLYKIIMIILKKRREENFTKQFLLSLLFNLLIFGIIFLFIFTFRIILSKEI